jgi:hypothetical protein
MKIFDQPENFPPILFHIWNHLWRLGPTSADDIVASLAPTPLADSVVDPDTGEASTGAKKMSELSVRSMVRVAEYLGIVRSETDGLHLGVDFEAELNHEEFWTRVRQNLLTSDPENLTDADANTLPVAISWYLTHPLAEAPRTWRDASQRLAVDYGAEPNAKANASWIIPGDTQWNTLVRWMGVLGFARLMPASRSGESVLVPDMSRAIRPIALATLDTTFIPVSRLVSVLVEGLPVLHDGRVWRRLPQSSRDRSRANSEVLYAALQTLEHAGDIEFRRVDDARDVTTFGADAYRLDEVRRTNR